MLKYLISKMIVVKVVPYLTFDYANVGKRIKQYRISIGKTQEELAEMAGISKNYLSDIETGKSAGRLDKYYNIAQALGVTVDMLINNAYNRVSSNDRLFSEQLVSLASPLSVSQREMLMDFIELLSCYEVDKQNIK